ncbi:MAG: CBS domain-containing protein [Myxococcales bacterium]|nr:CBS domain-containing protein [Myxococcales bacterium]MCB9755645.1 CBS domain-containing protein [Myxococcales bacterium]
MKRNVPISSIMSTDIFSVHTGQAPSEVRRLLAERPLHHVPVVSGRTLVGLISATDMLKLSFQAYGTDARTVDAVLDNQFTIQQIMTTELVTLHRSRTIRDAAELLKDGSFHSLPIVDDDDALVGIVTSTDIIRYHLEQY